jgi:hypothetical protein
MAVVDVSGISYFVPILAFLLVFVVVFATLMKMKFGNEHKILQLSASFLIATIFVTGFGAVSYLKNVSTWFAVLIISAFFLITILGLFGQEGSKFGTGLGTAFAIVAIVAFLISGMVVYGSYISPYLPWGNSVGDSSGVGQTTEWLYSGRVAGAILLVVAGIVASIILAGPAKKH